MSTETEICPTCKRPLASKRSIERREYLTQKKREQRARDKARDTGQHVNQSQPKRGSSAPTQFEITPALRDWADAQGLNPSIAIAETEKFLDHHRSKGSVFRDWEAAWRNWMRNEKKWNGGKNHEAHQRIDNSAPARVQRAIDERERKRQARGE
jgi:hypothetical protein